MAQTSPRTKIRDISEERDRQLEQNQPRFQRILRGPEPEPRPLNMRPTVREAPKEASLSPALISPSSHSQEEILYQCTQCDMIVKQSDPYCPFCGAIFADGPLADSGAPEPGSPAPPVERPPRPRDEFPPKEPPVRPERFDVFSLVKGPSKSKELVYREALRGFAGSARLLEGIEEVVSELSVLGKDTSLARRLISNAWEACRDGDWNLVTTLAREAEESILPSIPDLVMSEVGKARETLARAKVAGADISPYMLRIKDIMAALGTKDFDEALRLTKELTDSLREDSVLW